MNFSDAFQHTKRLVKFSPNGSYIASCCQYRLVVRDTPTLQILCLQTCVDPVQCLSWSPDSHYLMCGMFKRGVVQVWSIESPQWTCKIDEGSTGLVACCWAPDSRHVITTSEFQLRLTLWSLTDKSVSYIKYPKLASGGLDFTSDGKTMALAERRDCKDYISLFDCEQWKLIRNFPVETTDLAGLHWSPGGSVLCVWDSPLNYNVLMYTIKGVHIASYSAYDNALGVKCVSWSPTSQFLAIGSYDQKIRVLNNVTWKSVMEHAHQPTVSNESNATVYKEIDNKFLTEKTKSSVTALFPSQSKYELQPLPFAVPNNRPDPEKPNPKLGVGVSSFSSDGVFLATRNDNMPNALWIWNMTELKLTVVLMQSLPVCDIQWDPFQPRLAICTGNNKLYLWSPAGCVSVTVPGDFTVQRLVWHTNGSSIAIVGNTHFCVCYLND